MKLKRGIQKLMALVALGLATSACDALGDKSKGAVPACAEETKEGLISPSSFKLVWSEYTPRGPVTVEEIAEIEDVKRQCDGECSPGEQLSIDYASYLRREGPRLAAKLKRNAKLTGGEKADAELWLRSEQSRKERRAQIAKNLPEDQSAFVTIEYDAQNTYGTSVRGFAVCRFNGIGKDRRFDRGGILMSGPIDLETGKAAKQLSESARK